MKKAINPKEGATIEIKIANSDAFGNEIEREVTLVKIDDSKWADLDDIKNGAENLKKRIGKNENN